MSHTKFPMLPIRVVKAGTGIQWGEEWTMWPHKGDIAYSRTKRSGKFLRDDVDADVVRELFLAIKSPEDGLLFHRKTGFFISDTSYMKGERPITTTFSRLMYWQKVVKDLSVLPLEEWKKYARGIPSYKSAIIMGAPSARFFWDRAPFATIRETDGLDAVVSLIKVELMCGAEYRYCARQDCQNGIFRVESRHPRLYCSPECAHLVAVRNSRTKKPSSR